MSKEINIVEINTIETNKDDAREGFTKLDDLSLALVGGGECPVAL